MKTVAIIGGWSEGPFHARRMKKLLESSELSVISDVKKAEIIIAHSGGNVALPAETEALLVVFINPQYWPGRSILRRMWRNVAADLPKQLGSWGPRFLLNRLFNLFYLLTQPAHNYLITTSYSQPLVFADGQRYLLIRNQQDAYCSPQIKQQLPTNVSYKEVSGLHEDCWYQPKPYVDLILKEL